MSTKSMRAQAVLIEHLEHTSARIVQGAIVRPAPTQGCVLCAVGDLLPGAYALLRGVTRGSERVMRAREEREEIER